MSVTTALLTIGGTAFNAIGTGLNIANQLQQAKAQEAAIKRNRDIQLFQNRRAEQQEISSAQAALGASGVDPTSTTSSGILGDISFERALERQMIRTSANFRARQARAQGRAAAITSGFSGVGDLLSAGARAAGIMGSRGSASTPGPSTTTIEPGTRQNAAGGVFT